MISTRGRYALRVIIDLAEHRNGSYIPMKDVAARQEISLKYLERILPDLTKGNIIEGIHGKGGGYKLKVNPDEITVLEILLLTEGDMSPVACLSEGAPPCSKKAECRTLPMWQKYYEMINGFFGGITVSDLMKSEAGNDYII